MFDSADLHTRHTINTVLACLNQKLAGRSVNDASDLLSLVRSRLHSAIRTLRRRLLHSSYGAAATRVPFQAWARIARRHSRCDRMLALTLKRRRWWLKQQGFMAFTRCSSISNTRFVRTLALNKQRRLLVTHAFYLWKSIYLKTSYHTAVVHNLELRTQQESARSEREVLYETLREKEQLLRSLEEKITIQDATLDRTSTLQDLSLKEMEREMKELRSVIASQDQVSKKTLLHVKRACICMGTQKEKEGWREKDKHSQRYTEPIFLFRTSVQRDP